MSFATIACEECDCSGFSTYQEYVSHKMEQHGWSYDSRGFMSRSSADFGGMDRWYCKICKEKENAA